MYTSSYSFWQFFMAEMNKRLRANSNSHDHVFFVCTAFCGTPPLRASTSGVRQGREFTLFSIYWIIIQAAQEIHTMLQSLPVGIAIIHATGRFLEIDTMYITMYKQGECNFQADNMHHSVSGTTIWPFSSVSFSPVHAYDDKAVHSWWILKQHDRLTANLQHDASVQRIYDSHWPCPWTRQQGALKFRTPCTTMGAMYSHVSACHPIVDLLQVLVPQMHVKYFVTMASVVPCQHQHGFTWQCVRLAIRTRT